MYCGEYKKKITSKRFEMGLFEMNLLRTDVIPIVNYAWERSFARVQSNLKAIQDRGWGPLNKILLSHPEIIGIKISVDTPPPINTSDSDTTTSPQPPSSPSNSNNQEVCIEDINFNTGFAGNIITNIIRKSQRDQQIIKNINASNKKGTSFLSSM